VSGNSGPPYYKIDPESDYDSQSQDDYRAVWLGKQIKELAKEGNKDTEHIINRCEKGSDGSE
jgi:hypothetical protein